MPFKALGLHPLLVRATQELGYKEPTPVQAGSIPPGLAGRDIIATAQTGTGKTAAFLLPILHRLIGQPRGGTRVLILSPTRELAEQISEVCNGLAKHTQVRSALVVGGRPMGPQERALRAGTDIIVATPGRLLDFIQRNVAKFDRATTLVLDEADSLFDMGFLPDVRKIIARMPARSHTLLFSATMPPVIAKLANEILRTPATVQIGRRSSTAVGITQAAYPVPTHLKTALLRHLLRETDMPSVLVFTRTKHGAKKIARAVASDGFTVAELHSNRTPSQRTTAMEGFRRGKYQVMVATNIAARGLDVNHITHVISTDVPDVPEDYVHRIGRTGRGGATGDAFILVSRDEEESLARIERQVGQRLPRITLPDFDYTVSTPAPAQPKPGNKGSNGNRPAPNNGQQRPQKPKGKRNGPGKPGPRR
ncbi:rna helicase : ATP-dependent RNA helicase RhlE OS=Gemmatimonas aurantiaca (strain T-27 / DSM 14586 / JCM 11422 / NBRC 100505) GN=rhlE PE=3 SV=1: DEAD: Helicase_C [Gemmata massiliana]|uniref:RNA helicase n=1 Tax=Gemmata massiliana TaxID=1210884 RepID=A0A6P2D246_9BACT|nr:DEAD/DEAH box helicase [Gemmata massiliana]VTR95361.1 rna helicase : ATP-dependent RNA helicase RhlE OS=Gemmatimonas aurantiaca (strain T-27 / DSM 14586 / JCM 11422 / NBRC 100505) GN=rhlE PE=3 SV=1: DEAD: Helicase_C [Gemmata massiliana]